VLISIVSPRPSFAEAKGHGVLERGLAQVSTFQVRLHQYCLVQRRPAELRPLQLRVAQVRLRQVRRRLPALLNRGVTPLFQRQARAQAYQWQVAQIHP